MKIGEKFLMLLLSLWVTIDVIVNSANHFVKPFIIIAIVFVDLYYLIQCFIEIKIIFYQIVEKTYQELIHNKFFGEEE